MEPIISAGLEIELQMLAITHIHSVINIIKVYEGKSSGATRLKERREINKLLPNIKIKVPRPPLEKEGLGDIEC